MGSDGTYLAAGEQLIASVGLSPTYDFKSVYDHCSGSTRLADETTLGAFCSATRTSSTSTRTPATGRTT